VVGVFEHAYTHTHTHTHSHTHTHTHTHTHAYTHTGVFEHDAAALHRIFDAHLFFINCIFFVGVFEHDAAAVHRRANGGGQEGLLQHVPVRLMLLCAPRYCMYSVLCPFHAGSRRLEPSLVQSKILVLHNLVPAVSMSRTSGSRTMCACMLHARPAAIVLITVGGGWGSLPAVLEETRSHSFHFCYHPAVLTRRA
jgi:hypothetical protein